MSGKTLDSSRCLGLTSCECLGLRRGPRGRYRGQTRGRFPPTPPGMRVSGGYLRVGGTGVSKEPTKSKQEGRWDSSNEKREPPLRLLPKEEPEHPQPLPGHVLSSCSPLPESPRSIAPLEVQTSKFSQERGKIFRNTNRQLG